MARVYPADELLEEAVKMASKIGSMSLPATLMAKEAVNSAFEVTLAEGVHLERRMFHSAFALVSAWRHENHYSNGAAVRSLVVVPKIYKARNVSALWPPMENKILPVFLPMNAREGGRSQNHYARL